MPTTEIRLIEGEEAKELTRQMAGYVFRASPPLPDPEEWGQEFDKRRGYQSYAVFENGGQKALDEYFDKAQTQRQPRADNVTLQEMLKEL